MKNADHLDQNLEARRDSFDRLCLICTIDLPRHVLLIP